MTNRWLSTDQMIARARLEGRALLSPVRCVQCGEWLPPQKAFGRKRHYCSKQCRDAAAAKPREHVPRRLCGCGELVPTPYSRYCSPICAWLARGHSTSSPVRTRVCEVCGTWYRYRRKVRTCSVKCGAALRSRPDFVSARSARERLDSTFGRSISAGLVAGKGGRSWRGLVGYSFDELASHLESQFEPGMSWENYGAWHVDHIIARRLFTYFVADDPQFRACWALPNLRPAWAGDNLRKGGQVAAVVGPDLRAILESVDIDPWREDVA